MSAKKSQSSKRQLDPSEIVVRGIPRKEIDLDRLAQVLIRIAQEAEEDKTDKKKQPPKAA